MAKFIIKSLMKFSFSICFLYRVNCLIYENSYKMFMNSVHLGFESNLIENITKPAIFDNFFCLLHCSKRNECKMVIENKQSCFLLNTCFEINKISNQNTTNVYVKNAFCFENSNNQYIPTRSNITNLIRLLYPSNAWSLVVLPNGYLASGHEDSKILIWNVNNATKMKYFSGHSNTVNFLVVNKNGELVSGSKDKMINIWNINNGSIRLSISGSSEVSSLAVLENGDLVCSFDDRIISILDINNGTQKASLIYGNEKIKSIVVLNNSFIASGNEVSTVIIWNLYNNSVYKKFLNTAANIELLAVLKNGNIAIGGSETTIRILSLTQNKIVRNFTRQEGNKVNSLAVLSNGDLISCYDDKMIIWSIHNGTIIKEIALYDKIVSLAILNDTFFVSASLDAKINLWG